MIFWLFAGLLTAAALVFLLRPLLRGGDTAEADAAAYDIRVYRSQLEELDRDRARGQISESDAEAARAEIGRRLLEADRRRQAAAPATAKRGATGRLAPYAVALAVPGAAFGLYLWLGNPGAPDVPLALRDAERQQAAQGANGGGGDQSGGATAAEPGAPQAGSLDQAAQRLRRRLAEAPGDIQGWSLLGRTELMRGEYAGAVEAFGEALKLEPDNAELMSALGEARVLAADGTVSEPAKALFRQVLEAGVRDPRALYYLAEADFQAGRVEAALDRWIALAEGAPGDAPYLPAVRDRAEAAAGRLGVDLAARWPETASTGDGPDAPGPTAEDMAAAQDMSPEERQEMIRGMVEGLAARLEDNPMDFQGWMRLIRARSVLGETAKAQAALDTALEIFAEAPVPTRRLRALAAEQGLDAPAPADGGEAETSAAPTGPTAEDMAAAQDMNAEERRQMIQGMVDGLAARLAENPDDPEGWRMLARSYSVLGRDADALNALDRAQDVAPDDVGLMIERARLLRSQAGEQQTPESVALMRQVADRDPENVEANWFLGLDALRAGDRETARRRFERAIGALPEGSRQHRQLADEVARLLGD